MCCMRHPAWLTPLIVPLLLPTYGIGSPTTAGASATTPATSPGTSVAAISIIYADTSQPDPLSESDMREILAYTYVANHAKQPVWYIHVHSSRTASGERAPRRVTVFLTPEQTTPRLQRGYMLEANLQSLREPRQNAKGRDDLHEYVRVSPPSQALGSKLDLPTLPTWPFDRPKGFSDQEIIEIVDLVRTTAAELSAKTASARSQIGPGLPIISIDPSHQILSMERSPEGEAIVMAGSFELYWDIRGETIRCRKQNGKWVILAIGMWVS